MAAAARVPFLNARIKNNVPPPAGRTRLTNDRFLSFSGRTRDSLARGNVVMKYAFGLSAVSRPRSLARHTPVGIRFYDKTERFWIRRRSVSKFLVHDFFDDVSRRLTVQFFGVSRLSV